jgi:hypothetical protein
MKLVAMYRDHPSRFKGTRALLGTERKMFDVVFVPLVDHRSSLMLMAQIGLAFQWERSIRLPIPTCECTFS